MSLRTSELDLHRCVADFLSWVVLPPAVWTTFPAGWTSMRAGAAGRLKGCGLKAGMPDILIFYDGFTLGIELKVKTKPSEVQLEMFNKLRAAGVSVSIARSIEDVERTLRTYKIPMRKMSYGPPRLQAPEGRRPQKPTQGAAGATAQAEGT